MKKIICLAVVSFFLVPAVSAFKLYVAPEAGTAYSWYSLAEETAAKSLFDAGFSAGAAVEAGFFDFFWLKSGVKFKRLAVRTEWTVNQWSPPAYQSVQYDGYNMVEIPFLAGLYGGISKDIVMYAGIGAKFDFLISGDYWTKSLDPVYSAYDDSGAIYIDPLFWWAGSAVAGVKIAAGPGSVNTGLGFTLYFTGSELFDKVLDIELTVGYEFSIF